MALVDTRGRPLAPATRRISERSDSVQITAGTEPDADGNVPVRFTGPADEVRETLAAIRTLMEAESVIERGQLGEGYHSSRPDDGCSVQIAGTMDADSIIRPDDELPIFTMSWVPESRIDPRHVAFVRRWVNRAAAQLGMDGPSIPVRWFGPAVGVPDFWAPMYRDGFAPTGVTPDDEVGGVAFNKGLRGDGLVGIIAHEVRHVQQAVMRRQLADRAYREGDADDFAAAFLKGIDK